MNTNSFLREGGAFIIAFLLGSVSLHGMLFYLITDANDLFLSDSDSLFPLVAFISVYAGLPIAVIMVWRFVFKHDKLLEKFNLSNDDFYAFKRLEKIALSIIVLSWLCFSTYIILWLSVPTLSINSIEFLYVLSILLIVVSAFLFVRAILKLKHIKANQEDDDLKTDQDEQAEINERKFGVEFNLILFGWVILAIWVITLLINHTQFKLPVIIGFTEDHKPKSQLKKKLSAVKHNLGVYNEALDLMTAIHHESISSSSQRKTDESPISGMQRIDSMIDSWHITSDEIKNSFTDSDTAYYSTIVNRLKTNYVGKRNLQEIDVWIKNSENKLFLLRNRAEKALINDLLPVLIKSQNYFQLVFVILILMGILYWRVVMATYHTQMVLAKAGEDVEEPKQLEFTKGYMVFVFVLIVPILKPIENQNIEFHKPLWTVNASSFKPTKPYDPTPSEKQNSQVQIIFNEGDSIPNADYDSLRAEINALRILISNYNPSAQKIDLQEIEEQLDRIENELKKSKKR